MRQFQVRQKLYMDVTVAELGLCKTKWNMTDSDLALLCFTRHQESSHAIGYTLIPDMAGFNPSPSQTAFSHARPLINVPKKGYDDLHIKCIAQYLVRTSSVTPRRDYYKQQSSLPAQHSRTKWIKVLWPLDVQACPFFSQLWLKKQIYFEVLVAELGRVSSYLAWHSY